MPLKLLIAEDHDIVRLGIRTLLENNPSIEIVGEVNNGKDAIEFCRRSMVDVVLMDFNMPGMNGAECTRLLKRMTPAIKVLVLSMHEYEAYLMEMLQAGANGYILKNSCRNELEFAIKKVGAGGMYIDPEFTLSILKRLKGGFVDAGTSTTSLTLSDGERRVLELIADGYTNTQMANKLCISVRTIESRRKKLIEKTGTSNTATLIKYSIKNRLIV